MVACGRDRHSDYAYDVFGNRGSYCKNRPLNSYKQADIRAVVEFAQRIERFDEMQLQNLVLGHGYFPPQIVADIAPVPALDYVPWTEMIKRWADDFLGGVAVKCSAIRRRQYGIVRSKSKTP